MNQFIVNERKKIQYSVILWKKGLGYHDFNACLSLVDLCELYMYILYVENILQNIFVWSDDSYVTCIIKISILIDANL